MKKVADFWNTGFTAPTVAQARRSISGGPYMSDFDAGPGLTFALNDKYWGPPANVDDDRGRTIEDATASRRPSQNGEVQMIAPQANPDLLAPARRRSRRHGPDGGRLHLRALRLQLRRPLFQDKAVRQAFAYCLPRQEIVDKLVKPSTRTPSS